MICLNVLYAFLLFPFILHTLSIRYPTSPSIINIMCACVSHLVYIYISINFSMLCEKLSMFVYILIGRAFIASVALFITFSHPSAITFDIKIIYIVYNIHNNVYVTQFCALTFSFSFYFTLFLQINIFSNILIQWLQ